MSLQMPILQGILAGTPMYDTVSLKPVDGAINIGSISNLVHFDVQVACDIHEEKRMTLMEYGPLIPPYPNVWMEWQYSEKHCHAEDGREVKEGIESFPNWAMLVSDEPIFDIDATTPAPTERDDERRFYYNMFTGSSDGKMLFMLPVETTIVTDGKGEDPDRMFTLNIDQDKLNTEVEDVMMEVGRSLGGVGLLAIGLMNCRNVTHKEHGRIGMRRSGAEKRRKIPAKQIRYHTIVLPGGGTVDGTLADGRKTQRASSLHSVRGHCKRFTAERPLLGKHVGTYWWGWQVRGRAEKGLVISDYKIGERESV